MKKGVARKGRVKDIAQMPLRDYVSLRRKKLGLTQRAIALKLNVTVQHISNIETGRTIPSDSFCFLLAPILEVRPEVLVLMAHGEKAPTRARWVFTRAIEIALTNQRERR